MKTYLLDTIERFKRYSQSLDVQTILCQKAWYVLNEDGDSENLIFQEDGTVLVSVNGTLKKYTWQYIPQNQSLNIMHTDTDGTMLKPAFLDGKVLAFQKPGTNEYMFLIDDAADLTLKIKTLAEVKDYLLKIEQAEEQKKLALLAAEQKKKEEEELKLQREREAKEQIFLLKKIAQKNEDIERYQQKLHAVQESVLAIDAEIDSINEELKCYALLKDQMQFLKQNEEFVRIKKTFQKRLNIVLFFCNDITKTICVALCVLALIISMSVFENILSVFLLLFIVVAVAIVLVFVSNKSVSETKTKNNFLQQVNKLGREELRSNSMSRKIVLDNSLELDEFHIMKVKKKIQSSLQPKKNAMQKEEQSLLAQIEILKGEITDYEQRVRV